MNRLASFILAFISGCFAAGCCVACIVGVQKDMSWYQYKAGSGSLSITTTESWNDVDDLGDSDNDDQLMNLYRICFCSIYAAIVSEGVGVAFTVLLSILIMMDASRKSRKVTKIIGVVFESLGLLLFVFGALYYLRHPYYYKEADLCLTNDLWCDSFKGDTDNYTWGPDVGWGLSLLAALGAIPAVILLLIAQ